MLRVRLLIVMSLILLLLSACGLAFNRPAGTPTPTYPPPQDAPILPPSAALAAQEALALILGVSPGDIVIDTVEPQDWSDSCLGLGGPAESCLAEITPGYRVLLNASGTLYEYRTNLDGTIIRTAESPAEAELVERAAALLAQVAGLDLAGVVYQRHTSILWTNACLGAEEPGEACAEVITMGFRFDFEYEGQLYVLHTNQDLSVGRLGGPEEMGVALKVRKAAAQEFASALVDVKLLKVEMVDWNDSCLGYQKEGMMCAQVITPGYRVVVDAGGQQVEYHTNRDASAIAHE